MINPIVIIIIAAYVLSFLVFRIAVKPRKPVFTGVLLFLLILLVGLTSVIDSAIYNSELLNGFEKWLVLFATTVEAHDTMALEGSFRIFAWIDIALFSLTIISMYIELRSILISVYSERRKTEKGKKNEDKAKSDRPAKGN